MTHGEHGVLKRTKLWIEKPRVLTVLVAPPFPMHNSCRATIFQILIFAYFLTTVFSSPIKPYLVCEEKRWQSIFVFLTTNYIAHALTTIPPPGAKLSLHLVTSLSVLLVPYSGLIDAIGSVTRHFMLGGSVDLRRALAQKALLILVKAEDIAPGDIRYVIGIQPSFV